MRHRRRPQRRGRSCPSVHACRYRPLLSRPCKPPNAGGAAPRPFCAASATLRVPVGISRRSMASSTVRLLLQDGLSPDGYAATGAGSDSDDVNTNTLDLRIAAIFVVLVAGLVGGLIPLLIKVRPARRGGGARGPACALRRDGGFSGASRCVSGP
eukprot:352470-Chlamydomonas_euryale.AAC.5